MGKVLQKLTSFDLEIPQSHQSLLTYEDLRVIAIGDNVPAISQILNEYDFQTLFKQAVNAT